MKHVAYYWTRYLPLYPRTLVYMLQTTEYSSGQYLAWFQRTADFRRVMRRQSLTMTSKARLLLAILWLASLVLGLVIISAALFAVSGHLMGWLLAVVVTLLGPLLLGYGILLPLLIGDVLIQKPREKAIIQRAQAALRRHPAKRIAILGSYGKTTAKEMLRTVLAEGLKVAATPGNMNTPIGISRFVTKLAGDEAVLIFELGEEKPGDIRRLADLVQPELAIVTGINEAHLQSFKTLERTVATIYEITEFVQADHLYQNAENELIAAHHADGILYDRTRVGDWQISQPTTTWDGTEFTMTRGETVLHIHTALLGLHTVGVSAAVAAIATDLGLSPQQIEAGFQQVQPFEHRMQPRQLQGAWIIDDTYNGNSDGVKAGLALLQSLEAKRRIYVTPGLVEQGSETARVHREIGRQAAFADSVVLMKNSVTRYIQEGLQAAHFQGQLLIIDDPLSFYQNLDQFVAAGDVVLMQNDWTDNYL